VVTRRVGLFLSMLLALCWSFDGYAQSSSYVPGEVIVKLRSASGSTESFAFMGKAVSQKSMVLKASFDKIAMYHFALQKGQTVEQAVAELSHDPNVEYAEPNYIFRKADFDSTIHSVSVNDVKQASTQAAWSSGGVDIGLTQFHQTKIAKQSTTKPVVAVIDTGLDLNHPVFVDTNSIWTNPDEIAGNGVDDDGDGYVDDIHGWNFVDNSSAMYDDDGHGTHVSGIILSVDQDISPTAVRQESRIAIMPLKFLDSTGSGTTSDAIRAIYYAIRKGAQVMNNSWGGPTYSSALQEAIAYAYNAGSTFVAAAGNHGDNNDSSPMYPASYNIPSLISVAAVTNLSELADFSNFGRNSVHIGSPGVNIYSTLPAGGWGQASGTSMATPYVSGVAIQMKVESPQMLGYQIKAIVFNQAQTVSALNGKVYTGARLDANSAISYSSNASVDSSQPSYSASTVLGQDQELVSQLSGTGCGLVAKLVKDSSNRFGGGGPSRGPSTWYVLLIIALVAVPYVVAQWLKRQAPENRRRHERFRINSEVTVRVGEQELVGSISTISLGGVQLNTEAMLENGGIVRMQISSPDGKENVAVEGKVVWSEARKAYGVAFSNAPASALSRIGQWTIILPKAV
jgi:subtilisin family serine protease